MFERLVRIRGIDYTYRCAFIPLLSSRSLYYVSINDLMIVPGIKTSVALHFRLYIS